MGREGQDEAGGMDAVRPSRTRRTMAQAEAAIGGAEAPAPTSRRYFDISSSDLITSLKSAASIFAAPGSPGRET